MTSPSHLQPAVIGDDKTMALGRATKGFSDNDPARMRATILGHGYTIQQEDVETLPHSSVVRFSL